ncbi:MAG TPA: hypothetical protein VFN30_01345 [Chitinophagaceae bacterium]|nr:hypothetical protein [Chitinophagaceae bacterium]
MAYRNTLWLLLLLLTTANVYIYINRKNYEFVKQSPYAALYPNVSKGIKTISIEKNNEAVIDLKGYASTKWSVRCTDTVLAKNLQLPVRFTLKEKLNRYILTANDSSIRPIVIDLDYSPASLYKANARSIATNYEIRYSSIPFVYKDSSIVNIWKDEFEYVDTAEITTVKKIIDSLQVNTEDSTVTKIRAIGKYIYRSISKQMGVPADSLDTYSIYQQFCAAKDGRAKIWCGNITDIFYLFATNAGIICRNVGLSGNRNEFRLGDHSLNECYLRETGEWAYIDITQNILLLKDSSGRYLNTVDLYHLKKQNQTNGIKQLSVDDSSIAESNYTNADKKYLWKENELLFPYPHNPKTLYSFTNKFQRYISPRPWLVVYNDNYQYSNYNFYVKVFLFHAWLLLGLIMLVLLLFIKKRKS